MITFTRTTVRGMANTKNQNHSQHTRWLINTYKVKSSYEEPNLRLKRVAPSDLWIPKQQVSNLTKRISKFGCLKTVLHFLLKRNRNRLHSIFAYSENEKTLYQKTELELVRFSFRPDSADWAELRLAARYYGVSICNFFVMLLVFDENESVGKIEASWKDFSNQKVEDSEIFFIQQIFSKRKSIFFSISIDFNNSRESPERSTV